MRLRASGPYWGGHFNGVKASFTSEGGGCRQRGKARDKHLLQAFPLLSGQFSGLLVRNDPQANSAAIRHDAEYMSKIFLAYYLAILPKMTFYKGAIHAL